MAHRPRVQARALGKASLSQGSFNRGAVSAPSPKSGEVRRTALPDTFDGIRFQIGRMAQYVEDAVRDPVVRRQAEEIQGERGSGISMNGSGLSDSDERILKLQAIDDWCRTHARYINDPPNVEVIQTPGRMVKQTKVPSDVIRYLMTPFYEALTEIGTPGVDGYVPPSTYTGDCDEMVDMMTSLTACTFRGGNSSMGAEENGSARFFFQFGGNEGTLHHVWSKTVLDGTEFHADHTEPHFQLGDHSKFEAYEDLEVLS